MTAATSGEQALLAALIFCEAGGEPYEGQVAVGAVVMNRVRSGISRTQLQRSFIRADSLVRQLPGSWMRYLPMGGQRQVAIRRRQMPSQEPIRSGRHFTLEMVITDS